MKKTHQCPKCQSKKIYVIPETLDRAYGLFLSNSPMSLGLSDGINYRGGGDLEAYCCEECGFTSYI